MPTDVFHRLDEALADIARTGVVHVGAHKGQEVPAYRAAGFRQITLVEPNPALAVDLARFGDRVTVHQCAAGESGWAEFHVTEWDERSSLLAPVDYPVSDRFEVEVVPLADLQHGCNVAVLDCQGYELEVLQTAALDELDAVIVEMTADRRYVGAATRDEVARFLTDQGWRHTGTYGGHSVGITDETWRHPTCA